MPVNIYETRKMIAALKQSKPVRTFFLDTFFTQVELSNAAHVDIDIDRGGEATMAPFVSPLHKGVPIERRGFTTNSYKPPYIKPKMITTSEDLLDRQMGEDLYTDDAPEIRAAKQLGEDLKYLDDMITRREEWMAATGIQTGKIIVQGKGVSVQIDFDMLSTHLPVLGGTAKWADTANSLPIDNIDNYVEIVEDDSGLTVTDVILGRNAWKYFKQNTKQVVGVNGLFDNRRIVMGEIAPQKLPKGVKYLGHLNEQGVDLWQYTGKFFNDKDEKTYDLMDPNKILVAARGARCVRHYGAIKDLRALRAMERFPKTWIEEDPSCRMLMLQSAPLPAPHQIDAFLCATVC